MALTQSGEERAKADKEKEDKTARTKVRMSPGRPTGVFGYVVLLCREMRAASNCLYG